VFNVYTVRNRTFIFLTVLRVITAQSYQLFTDGTARSGRLVLVGLAFAALGVLYHSLHLMTRGKTTVGVSALTRVNQTLNTSLD
jgi:hypothetical protein